MDHVRAWVEMKLANGADERECELPFLTSALKMVSVVLGVFLSLVSWIVLDSSLCVERNWEDFGAKVWIWMNYTMLISIVLNKEHIWNI